MSFALKSRKITSNKDTIEIPRKEYEEFYEWKQTKQSRIAEEADTDEAIAVYEKEKKQGVLQTIKSLAELA